MDKIKAIVFIEAEIAAQAQMKELIGEIPPSEQEGFESWRKEWNELLEYVKNS